MPEPASSMTQQLLVREQIPGVVLGCAHVGLHAGTLAEDVHSRPWNASDFALVRVRRRWLSPDVHVGPKGTWHRRWARWGGGLALSRACGRGISLVNFALPRAFARSSFALARARGSCGCWQRGVSRLGSGGRSTGWCDRWKSGGEGEGATKGGSSNGLGWPRPWHGRGLGRGASANGFGGRLSGLRGTPGGLGFGLRRHSLPPCPAVAFLFALAVAACSSASSTAAPPPAPNPTTTPSFAGSVTTRRPSP